jgi:hypothetical protein
MSKYNKYFVSGGISASIVSDCRLHDRAMGLRSPAEEADLSSGLCVQTGSEAHPASYPVGTGGTIPGRKARSERNADHSLPFNAPLSASMAYSGTALFVHFCKWCFTSRKILRQGASGFTSPPNKDLKNQPPRPGLNRRTLGPMASALTDSPPMLHGYFIVRGVCFLKR